MGSFRQAILSANSTPGLDTILFGVGTGVQTIRPTSPLPAITDPIVIDGTTQPGYVLQPIIELDGEIAGAGAKGLVIRAGGSVVRGLAIRRFSSTGIELNTGGGNTVEGNFIGTDVTGTAASGNGSAGVDVVDSSNNTIGGMTPASRNVISGNDGDGIDIRKSGSSGNVVQGNLIGTDVTGTNPIGNGVNGIRITLGARNNVVGDLLAGAGNVISGNVQAGVEIADSSTKDNVIVGNLIGTNVAGTAAIGNDSGIVVNDSQQNRIGGTTAAEWNVISGNRSNGILIVGSNAQRSVVQGNSIGTDRTGTLDLGNSANGILITDRVDTTTFKGFPDKLTIGGTSLGAGNTIAFNGRNGVAIRGGKENAILGNSFFGNAALGIDLGDDGVTLNTGSEDSSLANRGINSPVFTLVSFGSLLTVQGYIGSAPGGSDFAGDRVEIFIADNDPGGYGEGRTYLGFLNADSSGRFSGSLSVSGLMQGDKITATANDSSGNSSEFAANLGVNGSLPASTTPADSKNTSIYGESVTFTATVSPALLVTGTVTFLDGASVLGTTTLNGGTATFTTSALPAGTHSITARYNGDLLHPPGTSAPLIHTVAPAALSVTAVGVSKVYGRANPSFTFGAAGLVNGDTNFVFSGSLTTLATAGSGVGTYGIGQGTLSAGPNYVIVFTGGTLTISPAALTITANDKGKTYGAALPSFDASYSGLVNSDDSSVIDGLSLSTTATAASNAGTYPITPSGATAGNYTISYVNGTLTVDPATLAITADDQVKPSGAAVPALSYSYSGLINGDTSAVFSGGLATSATASSAVGAYSITQGTLSADPNYVIVFAGGTLTISPAALTVDPKTITPTEGLPFNEDVATFNVADPSVTASHFLATIDWGDGQSSQGVIGYDAVARAFTVSGTHTYANSGDYDIDVTIQGVDGSTAETSSTASVADAPLTGSGRTITAAEGVVFSADLADFADANPNGTSGDFLATIDWGDGRTSTGVVTYDDNHKDFVVRGTHGYDEAGTYPIAVHIQDRGGASTVIASTANVADERLAGLGRIILGLAGSPRTWVVASFMGGDDASSAGDYHATITWGDGQESPGVVTSDGHGGYLVTGTNTYPRAGLDAVRVTIGDGNGSSLVIGSLSLVWDLPQAVGRTFSATAGTLFQGVVATVTTSDFDSRGSLSFTATIDWGDGASTSGVVTSDREGHSTVVGSHTFATPGTYPVVVTITTAGGLTATVRSLALVAEVRAPGGDDLPGGPDPPIEDGPPGEGEPELPIIPTDLTSDLGEIVSQLTVIGAGPVGAFVSSPVVTPTIPAPTTPSSPAISIPPAPRIVATQGNVALPSPTSPFSSLSSDSPSPDGSGQSGRARAGTEIAGSGPGAKPGPRTLQANLGGFDASTAGLLNALLARLDVAGGEAGAAAAAITIRQALAAPVSNAPATDPPAADALGERTFPREHLWGELDRLERQVGSGGLADQLGEVFGAGVVAYVGYVLLNSRSGLWLLSLLTARPLWKQFDPLQVLLAWDEEKRRNSGGRSDDEDEESLQSLVGPGQDTSSDIEYCRHVKNQSRPRKPHPESPVRRARTRTPAGS